MPFKFNCLQIPEVICVEPQAFPDERGFFMESYKHTAFSANGIPEIFVQENYSHSIQGVLRGLHYQKQPVAQGKLVSVMHGEIYDVAVDIRKGSPTYSQWIGIILSAENRRMLYVPEGFAHGFCVLSETADVVYKVTAEYAPDGMPLVWMMRRLGVRHQGRVAEMDIFQALFEKSQKSYS